MAQSLAPVILFPIGRLGQLTLETTSFAPQDLEEMCKNLIFGTIIFFVPSSSKDNVAFAFYKLPR